MTGKGTQHRSPLILQLLNNREAQLAAEAQKDPGGVNPDLQFFGQSAERDFGSVMEWVEVFFRVFWLSLVSGSFLLIWIFALKLAGY